MTTIVVSHQELGERIKEDHAKFMREIAYAHAVAAQKGVRVIRARAPVDTGTLRRSIDVEVTGAVRGLVALISDDTPYAAAQEAGTRPFTPPIGPLIDWATRQAPNLGLDDDAIEAFAYGVQKAIAARGIRARWFTRDAQPELGMILEQELVAAVARIEAGRPMASQVGALTRATVVKPPSPPRVRRQRRGRLARLGKRLHKRLAALKRLSLRLKKRGAKAAMRRWGRGKRRWSRFKKGVRKGAARRFRSLRRSTRRLRKTASKRWRALKRRASSAKRAVRGKSRRRGRKRKK